MSVRAIAWALDARRTGPAGGSSARLVLVTLADYADPDGRGAFPSKATIAERTDLAERDVRRHLAALREEGLIQEGDAQLVSHYRADRRPNVYDLNLDGWHSWKSPPPERGVTDAPPPGRGVTDDRNGGSPVTERGVTDDPQSKNLTNYQNPTPVGPSADDSAKMRAIGEAAQLAIEHAQAEALRCRRCGGLALPEHACRQAVPPPEYFRAMVEQARDG